MSTNGCDLCAAYRRIDELNQQNSKLQAEVDRLNKEYDKLLYTKVADRLNLDDLPIG